MDESEYKRRRYLGGPRFEGQPRQSWRQYAKWTAEGARKSKSDVLTKLVCQERGCNERLGYVHIDTSRVDRGPTIRVEVRAVWASEPQQPKENQPAPAPQ